MSTVSVNGTDLYYEEQGQGAPLLFIHGMCGDASVWADQMARLGPRYRVIAYDRRGHTRSPLGESKQRSVQSLRWTPKEPKLSWVRCVRPWKRPPPQEVPGPP